MSGAHVNTKNTTRSWWAAEKRRSNGRPHRETQAAHEWLRGPLLVRVPYSTDCRSSVVAAERRLTQEDPWNWIPC